MTNPPQFYIDKPIFQGQKQRRITCSHCDDWEFVGAQETLKHAWNDHWRQNHSEQVVAMRLHEPEPPTIIIAR